MAFRSMIVSKPAKISAQNSSIKIENDEGVFTIPAEDITSLMIENNQCSISGYALSLLTQNKAVTFICNDIHIPVGIIQNFQDHSTQFSRINQQVSLSKPFKNRVWQQIIKQKIYNQSIILDLNCCLMRNALEALVDQIESDDKKNIEGYASKIYFQSLFGSSFSRKKECVYNTCLNYGYTILRGYVARALVSYGFIPSLGIHHKNEYNNYNLADDFIEPFRPIVDLWVTKNINNNSEFSPTKKHQLIDIVNNDVLINNKKYSVSRAIELMISSYVATIDTKNINNLKLPTILDLNLHKNE